MSSTEARVASMEGFSSWLVEQGVFLGLEPGSRHLDFGDLVFPASKLKFD